MAHVFTSMPRLRVVVEDQQHVGNTFAQNIRLSVLASGVLIKIDVEFLSGRSSFSVVLLHRDSTNVSEVTT